MANKIKFNDFVKLNNNILSPNDTSFDDFVKGNVSVDTTPTQTEKTSFNDFVKGTASIAPQKTQVSVGGVKEAPKSRWQMATQGMGRTFASALGAISLPETIVGAIKETEAKKYAETAPEYKAKISAIKDPFEIINLASEMSVATSPKISEVLPNIKEKVVKSLKGELSETGTQKAMIKEAEARKGSELTKAEHAAATAKSIVIDILVNPSTYLTLGGSSALTIPTKAGKVGLTKAGTKAYAGLVKEGVAKGLTREAAETAAKKTMTELAEAGTKKYISQGGLRFAEWIPEVGGESIVPYKNISKVVEPIAKYTGLGKVYEGVKGSELARAVNRAVRPAAEKPEELYKFAKKAQALREYDTLKAAKEYIEPLKQLGNFDSSEASQIFDAIRRADIYDNSPDKIKKAADIIAQRFSTIRKSLVDRGIDIGYLDRYAPQLYADEFGKEFAENIKKFTGKKTIEKGGLKRAKEFFEYPRTLFGTVEEAEAAGYKIKKDIFELLEVYEHGANRIHAFMDVVEKIKPVGIDLTKKGAKIPKGFVRGTELLKNYAFPKDVANYLGSFHKTFFNSAELKTFLKYYDNSLRWWKTMATVVSPGFHIRNFLSNIFNSWLGGNKNPLNYMDAANIFKGKGKIVTQAGEEIAGSTVLEEAAKRGVVGRGWFGYAGELGGKKLSQQLQPVSKKVLKGVNLLSTESYLARGGRKLGITVEDYSRLAHFIDVVKKTGSFDNAAEETFKYLFDYSELTPFWRNIVNRLFPFGTWLRLNTPLQFEQIIKQPAKYGAVPKVKKFIESFSEAEKPEEAYLPEYLKKEIAMRLPIKDKEGNFIYMRLDLPYLGIGDVTDWRTLLGGITPALKIPAELGFGRELFTGKDIERYPGYTAAVPGYIGILPEAVKKKLGVVKAKNPKTGKIEERMNPYVEYLLRQNPLASKIGKLIPFAEETQYQSTSRPYSFASIMGGVGITPYDEQYRKKVYEKEQKELWNVYKKRLKEIRNVK